jgi:hypothetical protein
MEESHRKEEKQENINWKGEGKASRKRDRVKMGEN